MLGVQVLTYIASREFHSDRHGRLYEEHYGRWPEGSFMESRSSHALWVFGCGGFLFVGSFLVKRCAKAGQASSSMKKELE